MTNNSTNINKPNIHLSLQIIENKNTIILDTNKNVVGLNEIPLFQLSAISRLS